MRVGCGHWTEVNRSYRRGNDIGQCGGSFVVREAPPLLGFVYPGRFPQPKQDKEKPPQKSIRTRIGFAAQHLGTMYMGLNVDSWRCTWTRWMAVARVCGGKIKEELLTLATLTK